MWRNAIYFGIDAATGVPYVETCRGTLEFETVDDTASFVGARVQAQLCAQQSIWGSFEKAVESHRGAMRSDSSLLGAI